MTQSETSLTAAGISSVLTVGLDDAPPAPMQIGTPEDGDFRGYEVDLLEALARRLDVQFRYRRALWSVIVEELATAYAEDHDPLTRRELADRTEGKDLRDLIKSKFKKCTNKDILAAIDYAVEEGLLTTKEYKTTKGRARECLQIAEGK